MKLTQEQVERFIAVLDTKWPDPKICPLCGNTTWDTVDVVFELKSYEDDRESSEQPTIMPLVPLTCKSCGNTILINALTIGILAAEE